MFKMINWPGLETIIGDYKGNPIKLGYLCKGQVIPEIKEFKRTDNNIGFHHIGDCIISKDGEWKSIIVINEDEEIDIMLNYFNKFLWHQMCGLDGKKEDCFGYFSVVYLNKTFHTAPYIWDSEKWKTITQKLIREDRFK